MGTVASGTSAQIYFPLASEATFTPVGSALLSFSGLDAPQSRTIWAATTVDVPAGTAAFIEARDGAVTYTATTIIESPDGGVYALSEAVSVQTLTATGTAFSGACEFRGIVVRAISGTPQTVTVYDATSATGTAIATFTVSAVGTYYWDGDWTTAGNGSGGRRVNATGCHVVISGGTSRTIDVMVE